MVSEAIRAEVTMLQPPIARRLVEAYGIRAAEVPLAGSIVAAIRAADEIGYPLDLSLALPDDADDAHDVKIAIVLGNLDQPIPTIAARLCCLGVFIPVKNNNHVWKWRHECRRNCFDTTSVMEKQRQ